MTTGKFSSRETPSIGSNPSYGLLAISAALMMGNVHGYSQGVVYTDRNAFNGALQPIPSATTITFTGLTDPSPTGASPIVLSGVTFTNAESRLFVSPGYLWNFDSSYPVGVYLPDGKNAFGADFSGGIVQNNLFSATLTFTLLDGQAFTHNFTGQMGEWTSLGFAFSQPIRSIVYDDGGPFLPGAHEEMLDNVTFGVATVPEPNSVALALGGFMACFLSQRQKAR